jgi:hypothetical protein
MDDNAKELCKREERLFGKKANLDALNQELALNFYPERADFTTERALGEEFAADIFDSAPILNRRDLGNARAAMLRPRGQQWFRAATGDDEINERPNVARKLDAINKHGRSLIYEPRSGYVRASKEGDQDTVTFGMSVKTLEATLLREGSRRLLVRCWHLRDCAWLDDADGIGQDFMARRFKASARHIKLKYPNAELHSSITKALDKDPDTEFRLCHVMLAADEYSPYGKIGGEKAPWVSVYYDAEHKTILRERYSKRFRYVVDKWGTIAGSQYAYSPAALTALPDARSIQTMAMVLLEAGEKALDPPLRVVQTALKSDINTYAAGITFVDGGYDEKTGPIIAPLLPKGINPGIGIELINRTTLALRDAWYLTKLTLPQGAKTAFETQALLEEYIRANAPLFETWEPGVELELDEAFAVFMDIGAFGPIDEWPKELSGRDLKWVFENPLSDAIKKNQVNQAISILGVEAGIAKIDPAATHELDHGKMLRDVTTASGAPADWLRDEEEAQARKDQQAQAGDIVAGINAAGQAADVANTGIDAAAKLQEMNQRAVDTSAVYGPQ